mmetsp:Transcript_11795/g.32017  ORF Transcript_11795/g.32017 Transcript_11795/m.32017 type:complete len:243 (-) Transcript_11795:791-1519(-)
MLIARSTWEIASCNRGQNKLVKPLLARLCLCCIGNGGFAMKSVVVSSSDMLSSFSSSCVSIAETSIFDFSATFKFNLSAGTFSMVAFWPPNCSSSANSSITSGSFNERVTRRKFFFRGVASSAALALRVCNPVPRPREGLRLPIESNVIVLCLRSTVSSLRGGVGLLDCDKLSDVILRLSSATFPKCTRVCFSTDPCCPRWRSTVCFSTDPRARFMVRSSVFGRIPFESLSSFLAIGAMVGS